MKREIVCSECAPKVIRVMASTDDLAGEGRKYVTGALLGNAICDWCNKGLESGERATCVSIYSDRVPYYPWEHDYVAAQGTGREKSDG